MFRQYTLLFSEGKLLWLALVFCASLIWVTILPQPAAAESQAPMTIGKFDSNVAQSNGYEVMTLSDGTIISVQSSRTTGFEDEDELRTMAGTQGTVGGSCGTSYVDFDPFYGGFDLYSGFTVTVSAIDYSWYVSVLGAHGAYDNGFMAGGQLWFRDRVDRGWTNNPVTFTGEYSAIASGYALLSNGGFCQSANPTDTTYIEADL